MSILNIEQQKQRRITFSAVSRKNSLLLFGLGIFSRVSHVLQHATVSCKLQSVSRGLHNLVQLIMTHTEPHQVRKTENKSSVHPGGFTNVNKARLAGASSLTQGPVSDHSRITSRLLDSERKECRG